MSTTITLYTNMLSLVFFLLALTAASAFTASPIQTTSQQMPFATSASMPWRFSASASSENTITTPTKSSFASTQQQQPLSYRGVRRIEKFTRLPVWPVWSGVLIWMVQKLLGDDTAARLEHAWTGRVCPNFFQYQETSPFVMLVHHCHSFALWDPVRWIQRTFFPEGFPAHPHRGFITVTYILEGGFIHRDSTGVRQEYGGSVENTMSQQQQQQQRPHTQWLNTGSGMLHEEMFDNNYSSRHHHNRNWLKPVRQELYQLWLNVPAAEKWSEPFTCLLGQNGTTPLVVQKERGVKTLVLAGNYQGQSAAAPVVSDVTILHVQIPSQQQWIYQVPAQYETVLLYVRNGSGLECVTSTTTTTTTTAAAEGGGGSSSSSSTSSSTPIHVHHVAYMEATGDVMVLRNADTTDLVDFLVLAGEPLREPFFASGSMVMNYPNEVNQAYADYQRGLFGVPWDHKLSDQEWMQHIKTTSPAGTKTKVSSRSSLDGE